MQATSMVEQMDMASNSKQGVRHSLTFSSSKKPIAISETRG